MKAILISIKPKYVAKILNGDTLDDSIENLYITDNYHEYNALKVKGLCEIPSIVEASLETKKSIRKLEKEFGLL